MFAQRIAVVSSDGAAGYGDFCRQLADNSAHYIYNVELFAATMQGEAVEHSVIAALNRIYSRHDSFDVVVIIRGGGATSDLSGFDTLALAENVANFPLPVITGIGHDRDESVLDMVAHTRVKTPTAAAQLLIDNLARTESMIDAARQSIVDCMQRRMQHERVRVESLSTRIPVMFSLVKTKEEARVDMLSRRIEAATQRRIATALMQIDSVQAVNRQLVDARHRLQLIEQRVEAVNPERLLQRGYSITTYNGRAVRNATELPEGAVVETRVEKGKFTSVVTKNK